MSEERRERKIAELIEWVKERPHPVNGTVPLREVRDLVAAFERIKGERDWLATAHEATANSLTAVGKAHQEQLARADRLEMTLIQHAEVTDQATAERDRLRAQLTGLTIHVERLRSWKRDDAPTTSVYEIVDDLVAALAQPLAEEEKEDPNSSGGTP